MEPRKPLGNVVVAMDFSRHAYEALARAAWLPISRGAAITVAHAVPRGLKPELETRWRAAVDTMMRSIDVGVSTRRRSHGEPSVEVAVFVGTGRAAEVVAEAVRRRNAELVLVGRGEKGGLGPRILGSTADRIVRSSDVTTLIVADEPKSAYARPLVAVDLSETSRRELGWTMRIAPSVTTFDVLHGFSMPYAPVLGDGGLGFDLAAYETALKDAAHAGLGAFVEQAKDLPIALNAIVREGDPRRAILLEAAARNADLIVVGAHEGSTLGRWILGSVAEGVVRASERDVLVAR